VYILCIRFLLFILFFFWVKTSNRTWTFPLQTNNSWQLKSLAV